MRIRFFDISSNPTLTVTLVFSMNIHQIMGISMGFHGDFPSSKLTETLAFIGDNLFALKIGGDFQGPAVNLPDDSHDQPFLTIIIHFQPS